MCINGTNVETASKNHEIATIKLPEFILPVLYS